jgi:hypothetical protein
MKKKAQSLIEITSLVLLVTAIAFGIMLSFNKLKTNLAGLSTVIETAGQASK